MIPNGTERVRSLLSLPEAAEELRISRSQMYRMRAQGRLRVVRLGARVLVPYKEIERLIDEALGD
ncbi:helix-turn-helix domain-containing protein [Mycobacterium sp. D16Q16]|uniref:helix-turn-helix domain-containing protein n=1 Tax=Mycobacterium sp. D16Q16 TaxID=1855659 RepID=UPI0009947509|nr:helix-turn-helix domain-containing protein [Mycobacterium sp. D16Q16]